MCDDRRVHAIHATLTRSPIVDPIASRAAWWARHRAIVRGVERSIEAAILAGFAADRVGYAFGSGYQAALRALVPELPFDHVASLCVTERGGTHPRAIEARLEPAEGGHRLTGHKRWATLGDDAGTLLVLAAQGVDEHGKKRLRVVMVDASQPGVTRTPMPDPPFTPEIGHDEIDLRDVLIGEDAILSGDGFTRYAKPFRTIEDLHVQAAVYAYLLREVRAHALPRALADRFAGLLSALVALAGADVTAPEAHVALAGVLDLARPSLDELDAAWRQTESPAHARWERDRPLLSVAGKAREQRLARAWERLAGG